MILKSFQSRDKFLLFRAFVVYVRPILEYCCNVWSPYKTSDIQKIESVQRHFTKRLRGLKGTPYPDRLKCLNAESLEIRRIKFDLSMYYRILFDLIDVPLDNLFQMCNGRTRNNGLTLYKDKLNHNLERYIFRNRCINVWNLLPQYVVCSRDLSSFKLSLSWLDFGPIIRKASVYA